MTDNDISLGEHATELTLLVRDDPDAPIPDRCIATVSHAPIAGEIRFEAAESAMARRLLPRIAGAPGLTDADESAPFLLYGRYDLVEGRPETDGDAMPMLVIRITDLGNGAVAVEHGWADGLEDGAANAAKVVLSILARGNA